MPPVKEEQAKILQLENEFLLLMATCSQQAFLDQTQKNFKIFHKKKEREIVTSTDLLINQKLVDCLHAMLPPAKIISEEKYILPKTSHTKMAGILKPESVQAQNLSDLAWIIDPIDGTHQFAMQRKLFAISVALVNLKKGVPILGGVAVPLEGKIYYCRPMIAEAKQATSPLPTLWAITYKSMRSENSSETSTPAEYRWENVSSSFHLSPPKELSQARILMSTKERNKPETPDLLKNTAYHSNGSIALKLAQLACQRVDLVVSLSPKCDWDLAGGRTLLCAQKNMILTDLKDEKEISFLHKGNTIEGFVAGQTHLVSQFHTIWSKKENQSAV